MKTLIATLLLANFAMAAEPTPTTVPGPKVTTKDAKKSCKEEGKKGEELIKCMKEKKGQ